MNKLYKITDMFYKHASLLSDMAHRIMFGLLPTDTFDFVAAEWAAKGAIDVLYYGTKAVIEELKHYRGPKIILSAPDKITSGNFDKYFEVLSAAKKAYEDKENWDASYGGLVWEEITNTLIKILQSYKAYKQSEKYSSDQEKALRSLMINMNIFDGLAHNSDTVYDKMTEKEANDTGSVNQFSTLHNIKHLRDMSESKYSHDILKEVLPFLDTHLPYKDQIQQMKRAPEFYEDSTQRMAEHIHKTKMKRIFKASLAAFIGLLYKEKVDINRAFRNFEHLVDLLKFQRGNILHSKNISNEYYSAAKQLHSDIANPLKGWVKNIPVNYISHTAPKIEGASFKDDINKLIAIKDFIVLIMSKAYDKLQNTLTSITSESFPVSEEVINTLINDCDNYIKTVKRAFHKMDDISSILTKIRNNI